MAHWNDLVNHVKSNYFVERETDDELMLVFNYEDGVQPTSITHARMFGNMGAEDWVVIESPVGTFASVILDSMLKMTGTRVCGGLVAKSDFIVLRHALAR